MGKINVRKFYKYVKFNTLMDRYISIYIYLLDIDIYIDIERYGSSRIMHYVTKLISSQTSFLNMTMSSLYSKGLHSHQISIP